ncbi:MAG: hypothetical protein ACK5QX_00850, partial [bacterium]
TSFLFSLHGETDIDAANVPFSLYHYFQKSLEYKNCPAQQMHEKIDSNIYTQQSNAYVYSLRFFGDDQEISRIS